MNRIDYITSLATGYNSLADVGCDHAFISIKALKNYGVKKAYALDINDGPLENARMNVKSNGLEDNIEIIKSDGLTNLNDAVECIIIAGMGGVLISKIINDSLEKVNHSKRLILSPNNEEAILREYLSNNGFKISDEHIIQDAGHYYEIIEAIPLENEKISNIDILFGPILRKKKDGLFIKKYSKKLDVLESSLAKCNESSKKEIEDNIKLLKEIL